MPPGTIAGNDGAPGAPLSGVQGAVNVPFYEVVDALDQLRHGVSQAEVALVAKPFTYSILRARIRELLDR